MNLCVSATYTTPRWPHCSGNFTVTVSRISTSTTESTGRTTMSAMGASIRHRQRDAGRHDEHQRVVLHDRVRKDDRNGVEGNTAPGEGDVQPEAPARRQLVAALAVRGRPDDEEQL